MKRKSRAELRREWEKATRDHRRSREAFRAYSAATTAALRLAIGARKKAEAARRAADAQSDSLFAAMETSP